MQNNDNNAHYAPPSRREQGKAMGVAVLGGMLEYFEFIVFVYLAAQLSNHFMPPDTPEWLRLMQTFGIFAAGFLIRPIGGILMAQMGDRVGRKRIFSLSLLLMALPTFLIGLLPGYAQIGLWAPILLLACRLLQGLSLGGEFPGALCFVSEQISGRNMPLALGVLAASLTLGALLGSIVVSLLSNALGAEAMMEYGWRIPFILGGIFGFISVYIRRFTQESPVFEAMKAKAALSERPPFVELMARHRINLIFAIVMACAIAVCTVGTQQYPMTYFTVQKGLPLETVSTLQSILIFCTMAGNVIAGFLVARGAPLLPTFIVYQTAAILCLLWVYTQDSTDNLSYAVIALGLIIGGALSLPFSFLVRAFPAQQRYTGIATCYNIPMAVLGGTTLLVMTYLSRQGDIWVALYPMVFAALAIVAALVLWSRRHPVNPFAEAAESAPAVADQEGVNGHKGIR